MNSDPLWTQAVAPEIPNIITSCWITQKDYEELFWRGTAVLHLHVLEQWRVWNWTSLSYLSWGCCGGLVTPPVCSAAQVGLCSSSRRPRERSQSRDRLFQDGRKWRAQEGINATGGGGRDLLRFYLQTTSWEGCLSGPQSNLTPARASSNPLFSKYPNPNPTPVHCSGTHPTFARTVTPSSPHTNLTLHKREAISNRKFCLIWHTCTMMHHHDNPFQSNIIRMIRSSFEFNHTIAISRLLWCRQQGSSYEPLLRLSFDACFCLFKALTMSCCVLRCPAVTLRVLFDEWDALWAPFPCMKGAMNKVYLFIMVISQQSWQIPDFDIQEAAAGECSAARGVNSTLWMMRRLHSHHHIVLYWRWDNGTKQIMPNWVEFALLLVTVRSDAKAKRSLKMRGITLMSVNFKDKDSSF